MQLETQPPHGLARPGICYRLYTEAMYRDEMLENQACVRVSLHGKSDARKVKASITTWSVLYISVVSGCVRASLRRFRRFSVPTLRM